MNPRERVLAMVLLAAILLGGGGLLGKLFLLDPLNDRNERIKAMQKQIDERRDRVTQILADRPKLERWRQLSLPPDANLARREYQKRLSDLLDQSGFAGGYTLTPPKEVDTRNSPTLPGRKEPIYARLTFSVRGTADLAAIAEFLEHFYDTPLLHQIKNISLQRPQTPTQEQRPNDLDVNLTIEALIVSGVDSRPLLLPNINRRLLLLDAVTAMCGGPSWLGLAGRVTGPGGPLDPGVLADPSREYLSIAGKNIFFGARPRPNRENADVMQFVKLTDITRNGDKVEAFMYDVYDNRRTRLWLSMPFSVLDAKGEALVRGTVVRIDERDVYFRAKEKYYVIHVGQSLRSALDKPLNHSRIAELGLEKKEKKQEKLGPSPPSTVPGAPGKPIRTAVKKT